MTRDRRILRTTLPILLALSGCAAFETTPDHAAALASLAGRLDHEGWRPVSPDTLASDFRWRFEEPAADEPPLDADSAPAVAALAGRSDRVGRNALLLLARTKAGLSDDQERRLARIVRDGRDAPTRLPNPLAGLADPFRNSDEAAAPDAVPTAARAAAAEAWCRAAAGRPDDDLAEPLRLARSPDVPETVRAELLRGVVRHRRPADVDGVAALLNGGEGSMVLRRAVLDGCAAFAAAEPERAFSPADWPDGIDGLRYSADPAVRRGYGRWAAAARHPEAEAILRGQLADVDPAAADAATRSLGVLKTESARALLVETARQGGRTQPAAIAALAAWGADEVAAFCRSDSPPVRRAAAAALAACPSAEAAVLLDAAWSDADLEVQRRAAEAVAAWPDEFALPALLSGLESGSARTRQACLAEVRRRTGAGDGFPVLAGQAERAAAVRALAAEQGWPTDALTAFRLARPEAGEPVADGDVEASIRTFLAADADSTKSDAVARLRARGPEAVAVAERYADERPGVVAERLRAELLPAISPTHAALATLADGDVSARRQAAGRLAAAGREATLSPCVLRTLRAHLAREPDALVWRQSLAAVEADATLEAEAIAALATHHAEADVRRTGCGYVAAHPRPALLEPLLPRLSDEHASVRLAAIDAAGRCGNPAAIDGLRTCAAASERDVRLAAVVALTRLGDDAGTAALLRDAEYEPPGERAQAVQALAALGREDLFGEMLRIARAEADPNLLRDWLAALQAVAPADAPPPGPAASAADRLAAWAAWWERQAASPRMPTDPAR